MTLSEDGTAELRGLTLGEGTPYCIAGPIGGLASLPDVRAEFGPRGGRDGDAGGTETFAARLLTIPIATVVTFEEACAESLSRGEVAGQMQQALKRAWTRLDDDSSAHLELQVRQAWFESSDKTYRFYGRPRLPKASYEGLKFGFFDSLLEFLCVDPYGYGPSVSVTGAPSPVVLAYEGDAVSSRLTITVAGNGGTPQITSATDGGSTVAFAGAFSDTAVLDFHDHTVTVSGVDSYQLLSPAPEWFVLRPGSNTITYTGAASISVEYQPAYL